MNKSGLIKWFLKGDVSIQYQVHRDLLDSEQNQLRKRISLEGWGAAFLSRRQSSGHWGRAFYQPKWTSIKTSSLYGVIKTLKNYWIMFVVFKWFRTKVLKKVEREDDLKIDYLRSILDSL